MNKNKKVTKKGRKKNLEERETQKTFRKRFIFFEHGRVLEKKKKDKIGDETNP